MEVALALVSTDEVLRSPLDRMVDAFASGTEYGSVVIGAFDELVVMGPSDVVM